MAYLGTPEWRANIAKATRKAMNRPDVQKKLRARRWSPEMREHLSRVHTGHKASEETRRKMRIAQRARILRGDVFHSKLEQRARKLLKPYGLHKRVYLQRHAFDCGSKSRKLVIEINGCWLHDHRCDDRRGKEGARAKDKRLTALAEARGYRIAVLWECQESRWIKILIDQGFLRELPPKEDFEE